MVADFDDLYQIIPGADAADNARYRPAAQDQLAKVGAFRAMLADVRDVMIQELAAVDRSVAGPAKEARKHIDMFRKTIKKREDRKVRPWFRRWLEADVDSWTGSGTRVGRTRLSGRAPSPSGITWR
jgi:hypothetical protein